MYRRSHNELMRATLAAVAPGTQLRDGLERILRGGTGALIVLGSDKTVEGMCSGGFGIDIAFSATRLRELAKMDGAIVLNSDVSHIVRAATQLLPNASIQTNESGTRHRTAERVAKQTGFPVVSVSQSMQMVALYVDGERRVVEGSEVILAKANQALATLTRYKTRLDEVTSTLSALEIEDLVTLRDVAVVLQRLEMVLRIDAEMDGYVVELGTDGRLITLQLEELLGTIESDRELLVRDYLAPGHPVAAQDALDLLRKLSSTDLLDISGGAAALGYSSLAQTLDDSVSPLGYRLLSRIPRLPGAIVDRLVDHFGGLQRLLTANLEDLMAVDGVGEGRARAIRGGLSRLAESSILERYV